MRSSSVKVPRNPPSNSKASSAPNPFPLAPDALVTRRGIASPRHTRNVCDISDGGASSVDGELWTLNKAGGDRSPKRRLRRLFRPLSPGSRRAPGRPTAPDPPHRVGAFSAGGSGTHCIDIDNPRTILSRPCFGQQIEGPCRSSAEGHILFAGGRTCKSRVTAGLGSSSREHFCLYVGIIKRRGEHDATSK